MLDTIFRETWSDLLAEIDEIEAVGRAPRANSSSVSPDRLLGGWRVHPDVTRVLVREIARSAEIQAAHRRAREADRGDPADHRAAASRRASSATDFDSRLAGIVFYGGIEEVLSGWVLGQIPDGDAAVEAAQRTLIDVVCAALSRPAPPPSSRGRAARRSARRRRCRPRSIDADAAAGAAMRPASSAATPIAPLGSVTIFSRSKRNAIASTISASLAVTISSTRCRFTSNVSSPGLGGLQPVGDRPRHAAVDALARGERAARVVSRSPARRRRRECSGRSAFATVEQPAISPPPPTGVTSRSSSGTSSSSSSAVVPWPAITSGSSYGAHELEPTLERRAAHRAPRGSRTSGRTSRSPRRSRASRRPLPSARPPA